MNVRAIYDGSSGEATKALYATLDGMGPAGILANVVNNMAIEDGIYEPGQLVKTGGRKEKC